MDPVPVWEGTSTRRLLTTVEDLALFLLYQWPAQHKGSKLHIAAQLAVLQTLEGKKTEDSARKAFVKAAEDADVLAKPREPPLVEGRKKKARPR